MGSIPFPPRSSGRLARANLAPVLATSKTIKKLATRLAAHFTRSTEDKQEQPNSDQFENTQIRLEDGSVIFTPNLFGQGISVTDVTYKMAAFDGGLKYHGYSLEGEYFLRWLDNFHGPGTTGLPRSSPTASRCKPRRWFCLRLCRFISADRRVYRQIWQSLGFSGRAQLFPFSQQSRPVEQ